MKVIIDRIKKRALLFFMIWPKVRKIITMSEFIMINMAVLRCIEFTKIISSTSALKVAADIFKHLCTRFLLHLQQIHVRLLQGINNTKQMSNAIILLFLRCFPRERHTKRLKIRGSSADPT